MVDPPTTYLRPMVLRDPEAQAAGRPFRARAPSPVEQFPSGRAGERKMATERTDDLARPRVRAPGDPALPRRQPGWNRPPAPAAVLDTANAPEPASFARTGQIGGSPDGKGSEDHGLPIRRFPQNWQVGESR